MVIVCSCDAYPLSADNYVLIFNETFTSSDTTNVTATIADHLISYDVVCEVDNGISRQKTVKIIFDFCKLFLSAVSDIMYGCTVMRYLWLYL